MSTDTGSDKDLALSEEDAEQVVGGKQHHRSGKPGLQKATERPLLVEGSVYPTTDTGSSDNSIYDPELTDPTDPNSPDYVGP